MNVRTLKAADFPGIDQAKFEEWKALSLGGSGQAAARPPRLWGSG